MMTTRLCLSLSQSAMTDHLLPPPQVHDGPIWRQWETGPTFEEETIVEENSGHGRDDAILLIRDLDNIRIAAMANFSRHPMRSIAVNLFAKSICGTLQSRRSTVWPGRSKARSVPRNRYAAQFSAKSTAATFQCLILASYFRFL